MQFAMEDLEKVVAFETALANVMSAHNNKFMFTLLSSFHFWVQRERERKKILCAKNKVSLPEADRHDTSAIYKKQTLSSLERDIPEFNWRLYLKTFVQTELPSDEPIVSYAFPYLKEMAFIVKATEPR